MTEFINIQGACHCKAIQYVAKVPKSVDVIRCNCSICSMTGYQHLIVPHANFQLQSGNILLTEYLFGTQKAKHLFCQVCGIKSFYQPRSHPNAYSLNLNCCSGIDCLEIKIIDFDGQNWEDSIASIT